MMGTAGDLAPASGFEFLAGLPQGRHPWPWDKAAEGSSSLSGPLIWSLHVSFSPASLLWCIISSDYLPAGYLCRPGLPHSGYLWLESGELKADHLWSITFSLGLQYGGSLKEKKIQVLSAVSGLGGAAQLMSDFQMSRVSCSRYRLYCRGCHKPRPPHLRGEPASASGPLGRAQVQTQGFYNGQGQVVT